MMLVFASLVLALLFGSAVRRWRRGGEDGMVMFLFCMVG